VKIFTWRFLRI